LLFSIHRFERDTDFDFETWGPILFETDEHHFVFMGAVHYSQHDYANPESPHTIEYLELFIHDNDVFDRLRAIPIQVESGIETSAPAAAIYITSRNNELLSRFGDIHVFDYLTAYNTLYGLDDDHWFFDINDEWGIVIWADIPLHNFQLITIYHDFDEEEISTASHVLYEIDELMPMTPILLDRFVHVGGVIPWEGISFIDPSGTRRYFALQDDRRGYPGDPPWFLLEFENGGIWGSITTYNSTFSIALDSENIYGSMIVVG